MVYQRPSGELLAWYQCDEELVVWFGPVTNWIGAPTVTPQTLARIVTTGGLFSAGFWFPAIASTSNAKSVLSRST